MDIRIKIEVNTNKTHKSESVRTTWTTLTDYGTLFGILSLTLCITQYYTAQRHKKVFVVIDKVACFYYFFTWKCGSAVFQPKMFATSRISAVILVSRVNSANPDISRDFCLAIWSFFRFQIVGLQVRRNYTTSKVTIHRFHRAPTY